MIVWHAEIQKYFQSTHWYFAFTLSGEIPSAQSNELPALSNAWSSNPLDYLNTLEAVQSNNGEPNWGPNHATERTQSVHWIKLARLPLTSQPSGRRIQDPESSYQFIPVLSLLSRSGLMYKTRSYFLIMTDFLLLPLCRWSGFFCVCVGGKNISLLTYLKPGSLVPGAH